MQQQSSTGARVFVTVLASTLAGAAVLGAALAVGDARGASVAVGIGTGVLVSLAVGGLMRGWALAPLASLASRRLRVRPNTAEGVVGELMRQLDDLDRSQEANRQTSEQSRIDATSERDKERDKAAELERRATQLGLEAERMRRWQRLHALILDPILAQLGRAIERVIAIDTQPAAARPLLRVARAAALWAEEALETLQRVPEPNRGPQEPFSLRDEIGTLARSLALGLGREVSLRFAPEFPTQATTDRTRLRLAMLAVAQLVAKRDAEGELVVEASFQDGGPSGGRLTLSIDSRAVTTGALAPASGERDEDVLALGELVGPAGGEVLVGPDRHRLGFTIEATRQRRTSGLTLYGVGALSERSVLVLDPRPRGRALLCEQLVGWRMAPTAVSDVAGALEAVDLAERAKKPFDALIVCPRIPGLRSDGTPPELTELAAHPKFRELKLLSLETFDTLTAVLPPGLGELDMQRVARPAPPLDLLEALTVMIAPKPGTRTPLTDKTRIAGGLSVLVVEDNPVNQALIAKMLDRRGHQATIAPNGADAVDRLQESPDAFDLVLMDIQMPVMDGYEATTVIRLREKQSGHARMPIIAVTAHAMSGERDKCIEAGMDAYLAKPVSEAELMSTIDETVRRVRHPEKKTGPQPQAVTSDVFDARRVLDFAAGDQAFLRTLVDIYTETTPKQVAAIEHAINAQDGTALLRAAHQVKGSVGNFAAERARRLAAELEEHGRRKDFASASRGLDALRGELDMLGTGLRQLVGID